MSEYTMQLRELMDPNARASTTAEKIEATREYVFDFDYPFYDESKRAAFERDFVRNFYMREIGQETDGLFKLRLENWLHINMPYYNQLLHSQLIQFDPLTNTKISSTETRQQDTTQDDDTQTDTSSHEGTSSSNQSSSGSDTFDRSLEDNTPDSRLQISTTAGGGTIEYASNITEDKSNSTSDTHDTGSSDSDTSSNTSQQHNRNQNEQETSQTDRTGKIGDQTYAKMLQEYRATFIRIEKEIFRDMEDLFMIVY